MAATAINTLPNATRIFQAAGAIVNNTVMITFFGLLVVVAMFVYFWWSARNRHQ